MRPSTPVRGTARTTPLPPLPAAIAAFVLTLALSGCGDGNTDGASANERSLANAGGAAAGSAPGPDAVSADTRPRGTLSIVYRLEPETGGIDVSASAAFLAAGERWEDGDGGDSVIDETRERIDECELAVVRYDPDTQDDIGAEGTEDYVPPSLLSAGETLTLTSPAGTWLELVPEVGSSPAPYSASLDAQTAVPEALVLDIPGDEFPAFVGLAVPGVELLIVSAPEPDASASPALQLRWMASDGGGRVEVFMLGFDELGPDEHRSVSVRCDVPDSGAYVLPPEVLTALAPFVETMSFPQHLSLSRRRSAVYERSDAVVEVDSYSRWSRDLVPSGSL